MFENALWKNPIGWAMKVSEKLSFWMLVSMHIFGFIVISLSCIFIFTMVSKLYIKCTGFSATGMTNIFAGLILPFLAFGVIFPVYYLYALRAISSELKKYVNSPKAKEQFK